MSFSTIVIAENTMPDYLRRYYLMRAAAERLDMNMYEDQESAAQMYAAYGDDIQESLAIFKEFTQQVQTSELIRDLPLNDAVKLVMTSEALDANMAEAVAYNSHVDLNISVTLFRGMIAQTFNDTAQATARALLTRFNNLESYLWITQYNDIDITDVDPEVFDFFTQEASLLPDLRVELFERHLRLLREGRLPFAYQLGTMHLFSFDQDTDALVENFSLFDQDARNMFVGSLMSYVNNIPAETEDAEQGMFRAQVEMLLFRLAG